MFLLRTIWKKIVTLVPSGPAEPASPSKPGSPCYHTQTKVKEMNTSTRLRCKIFDILMLINVPAVLLVLALRCSQEIQWLPDTHRHMSAHSFCLLLCICLVFINVVSSNQACNSLYQTLRCKSKVSPSPLARLAILVLPRCLEDPS